MLEKLLFISQKNSKNDHIESIETALEAGCKWIQLRVKNESDITIKQYAIEAKKLCDLFQAKLTINDYPHIAKEVSAYGVHLGLKDISLTEARRITGKNMVIGGTANTYEDIHLRTQEGADYIGSGPFRFTSTKENLNPVLGLDGYHTLMTKLRTNAIKTPVIAIGGIELADVSAILKTGVYGIAVSGAITNVENITDTVLKLQATIEDHNALIKF